MARLTTICIGSILVGVMLAGQSYAAIDSDTILGAWLLDEGSGDLTADTSGNGHDGTLMGSPGWVTGAFGSALEFNGSSTYVDCGNAEALNVDLFSVSFWCNIPTTQAWNHMISRGQHVASGSPGSVNWGVMMYSDQETILFETFNDTGWVGISTPTSTGEWHHVAATYDGDTMQLYHDGELGATASGAGILLDESRAFIIGARSDAGSVGGFFNGSLDEVGYFNAVVAPEDIETIMNKGLAEIIGGSPVAVTPDPAVGQTDVPRDLLLSWTPGEFAATHNVYFSDNFDDVNGAAPSALIADSIAEASVDPGHLAFETTYYWRVDEVNSAPDYTVFEGTVWNFTVEPLAYPITNVTATSNATYEADAGPENTINGSGLNELDQHSIDSPDMFLGKPSGDEPFTIQYEFDTVYKLHEMLVWNYNVAFELLLGFGFKDTTVEYSVDRIEWTALPVVTFAQATAKPDYAANTTVAFDGVAAKFVRLTVISSYDIGMLLEPEYGLSEVRFMYIPAQVREPQPADGAANVSVDTTLTWRAGRDAVSHEVYFRTDPEALPLVDTVSTNSYAPGALDLGTTYYWQITAVQDTESWAGDIWSFSTQAFFVVEDFESYNDDDNLIYETWLDGWVNGTGSTVGYFEAPFAETTIVHSGRQSMPLLYDNTAAAVSEADLELSQDWTTNGIRSLSLYFHGDPDNSGGQLYIKINNTKVAYNGAAADITEAAWLPWNIDLSAVGNVSNVSKLTIGIEGAGASGIVYIDDVRLYPQSPEYIVPTEPDSAGLVALYKLDGNADDGSGNGFNGTVNGAPTYVTGKDGQAIRLNGTTDYVVVGSVGISGAASRTISGWVKPDTLTLTDWTNIFGFTSAVGTNDLSFDMNKRGGENQYCIHVYGWERNIMEIDLEWHHLAATYDGTTIAWYGDGRLLASEDHVLNTEDNVQMGKRANNEAYWPGSVDEVHIYNQALSAEEIAWLAGRTEPLHTPF